MLKHYKMTFTQDRKNLKTYYIPAQNLAEAYIFIEDHFPNAEIIEAVEGNKVVETWAHSIAKYLIANASLNDACKFASFLDEEKCEELVNAIWDEWHRSGCSIGV